MERSLTNNAPAKECMSWPGKESLWDERIGLPTVDHESRRNQIPTQNTLEQASQGQLILRRNNTHGNRSLEEEIDDLGKRVKEKSAEVKRLEKENQQLQEQNQKLQKSLKESGAQRQQRLNNSETQELREELQRFQDENEEIRMRWQEATNQILTLTQQKCYNLDDEFFKGKWHNLAYKIKNYTCQHFCDIPKPSSLWKSLTNTGKRFAKSDLAKDDLRRVCPDFRSYLKSKDNRAILMQAYIWRLLMEYRVFGTGLCGSENHWAGDLDASLAKIADRLRPSEGSFIVSFPAPATNA